MRPTRTAALAAALLITAGVSAGNVSAQPTDEPAPPAEPTESAAPGPDGQPVAAPPGPKTTIDADGTYAVGTDIVPGTYSSAGPVPDGACYWKRTSGDAVIDNAMTKKPQVVQIMQGDTAFTTNDCQTWQLTNAPVPPEGSATDILAQFGKLILTGPKGPARLTEPGAARRRIPGRPRRRLKSRPRRSTWHHRANRQGPDGSRWSRPRRRSTRPRSHDAGDDCDRRRPNPRAARSRRRDRGRRGRPLRGRCGVDRADMAGGPVLVSRPACIRPSNCA